MVSRWLNTYFSSNKVNSNQLIKDFSITYNIYSISMALIRYEFYYMMIDNDLVTSVVFTTSFYYLIINEFGSNFDLELKIILGLTTLGFLYSIFHNDYSHVFIYLINTLLKIGVSWKNSYEKRKTYKDNIPHS